MKARTLSTLFRRRTGASAVEFGILIGLVALVALATVSQVGGQVSRLFFGASNSEASLVPTIVITSPPSAVAENGVPFAYTPSASGGNAQYTWSMQGGTLPTGLTFAAATGTIAGTPTTAGTAALTLAALDTSGATATLPLNLAVSPPLQITSSGITLNLDVGSPANFTETSSGGSGGTAWSIISGTLPAGLSFSSAGVLSGTPTATGQPSINFRAHDSAGGTSLIGNLSFSVSSAMAFSGPMSGLVAAGTPLPTNACCGLFVSGGSNKVWTIQSGSLPPGTNLSVASGRITGVPTTAGTYPIGFLITDQSGATLSGTYTLTVEPPLVMTSATSQTLEAGVPFTYTLTASGGSGSGYTWRNGGGSVPSGGTFNTSTGVISGIASLGGGSTTTMQPILVDSAGVSVTQPTITWTILPNPCPCVALPPSGTVNTAYNFTVPVSGGSGSNVFSQTSGTLPPGMSFNANGVFSGTPTASGSYNVGVKVQDAMGGVGTNTFTLTIN